MRRVYDLCYLVMVSWALRGEGVMAGARFRPSILDSSAGGQAGCV